jgi:hypothetical protein
MSSPALLYQGVEPVPNPPPKKRRASKNDTVAVHYLKMSPMNPDTLPGRVAEIFSLRFFCTLGLPISPNLLCWWALEVPKYVRAPTAVNIRQTRQTVALGLR